MHDPAKAEIKKEKKIKDCMLRSFGAAGIGLGLFLMRFLVAPFIGDSPEIKSAIVTFALSLIAFGGIMVVVFLFKRDLVTKIYMLMLYLVLPIILLKQLAGIF